MTRYDGVRYASEGCRQVQPEQHGRSRWARSCRAGGWAGEFRSRVNRRRHCDVNHLVAALPAVRARGVAPALLVATMILATCACSAPKRATVPGTSTPPPQQSVTTTYPTTPASSTLPPSSALAVGASVPGYEIEALSFISDAEGFGLFEPTGRTTQQLAVTSDGGLSWKAAAPTVLPAWASTLEFVNDSTGYAWGQSDLEVTSDGGQHWRVALQVAQGREAVSPIGTNVWAITPSNVLEESSDGGISWHKTASVPVPSPALLSRVSSTVAYVLGCGQLAVNGTQPGSLAWTRNAGHSWTRVTLPNGCTAAGTGSSDLVALSVKDLWLVQFGQPATDLSSKWVYRSYDSGAQWQLMAREELGNPADNVGQLLSTGDFGPLSVLASNPSKAWLAEDRGGLLVTTDGGADWAPAYQDPNVDALGPATVSFLDSTHGWAAAGDGLWRTTDGVTWTDISPASFP